MNPNYNIVLTCRYIRTLHSALCIVHKETCNKFLTGRQVYTDDNIFVLIEASKSLLSIGVWDCAALEIVLQAIKYGSQGLRFTLLEALRTSSNPNSVNKQSVQFRVLQGLLLNLIRRGSHVPQTEESKGPTFTLPTDTPR